MRQTRPPRRTTSLSRAAWRIGCGLLLAAAVLFGTAQSGARYFYCDALGLMTFDPCVGASDDAQPPCPSQALQQQAPDCCQRITLPALPNSVCAGARALAPASAVSLVLIANAFAPRTAMLAGSRARWAERWQLPPPTARDRRAQLMVSLT